MDYLREWIDKAALFLVLAMFLGALHTAYKRWGLHAVLFDSYKPMHGSHVRSRRIGGKCKEDHAHTWSLCRGRGRTAPQHNGPLFSVRHVLANARSTRVQPSDFYPVLRPSRKGMAHAA